MNGRAPGQRRDACASCLRRSWLLAELTVPLEYSSRGSGRLLEALALDDEQLVQALAGRRRAELRARYQEFDPAQLGRRAELEALCRHDPDFPPALAATGGPAMLNVAGSTERFLGLAAAPIVAVLGSAKASDYGIETARGLARGLAASGVTVLGGLTDGITLAAHSGALELGTGTIAVVGGGLGVSVPARRRRLYAAITRRGCAVSELPNDCRGRRWGQIAGERILTALASVTVIVEAEDTAADVAAAGLVRTRGGTLAAVPGRVSSPLSRGTHTLLMDGAALVRGADDVLELLYATGGSSTRRSTERTAAFELEPRLNEVLEWVGAGRDTPDALMRAGADPEDVLPALSELELMGLLVRGDGGRYLADEHAVRAAQKPL